MRTGRYRVRPGLFGRAILQAELDSPMFIGGWVDASIREITWHDVKFSDLPNILFYPAKTQNEEDTVSK